MTATLTPPTAGRSLCSDDPPPRRPLVLLAALAGTAAAASTLVVAMGLGVIGWFLADGGVHGEPRDALRVGALGWLMSHGSGVTVQGIAITALPLGLSLICAWAVWRFGLSLGESVAGHGPDATTLADGDRDWTVPMATTVFAVGYLCVATATTILAGTPETTPSLLRVWAWVGALTLIIAAPAIAIGSGRAALWMSMTPISVRAAGRTAGAILIGFLALSVLIFLGALILDFGAAANVFSRLHTDTGDAIMISILILTLVPNAVIFAGSYLLGPGFTVGVGTLVSPSLVAVGPVPAFPLLAALPDNGPVPAWTPYLVAVPGLVALVATVWSHGRMPTRAWDQGALRGLVGGVIAAVCFAALAVIAGGAVGPGRMSDVGPLAMQVLVNGIVTLGLGGLLGGVIATWWHRRHSSPEDEHPEGQRPEHEPTIRLDRSDLGS